MAYDSATIEKIRNAALYLDDKVFDTLLEKIGDASIVLLGEATHGTHEFYDIRAQISKKLILEKDFNILAIEGDWPDAYQINQYIHSKEFDSAQDALSGFDRFPTWMWQNIVILQFVEWLKTHNYEAENKVNFYGLDLYSLYRSIDVIISYLQKIDPKAAQEAKYHYGCFEQFRRDPENYAYSVFSGLAKSCQNETIAELKKLETAQWQLIKEKKGTPDEFFYLIQNARVVKNSEAYYRSLFIDEVSNWNLRDTHMMETVEETIKYYKKNSAFKPKIIIWAHNSHLGDASATEMGSRGEFNIGQLVKEKFGSDSFGVGFITYNGTVSAASGWHGPVERKNIRNALPGSYEDLFHAAEISKFLLLLDDKNIVPDELLERAIGVIYAPRTERLSHYFYASLAYQFDAVIHYDKTTAVEPLDKSAIWIAGELPETYPSGL